jgi:hypothetical protein
VKENAKASTVHPIRTFIETVIETYPRNLEKAYTIHTGWHVYVLYVVFYKRVVRVFLKGVLIDLSIIVRILCRVAMKMKP